MTERQIFDAVSGIDRSEPSTAAAPARTTYLLHHGAAGNSYYALYARRPRVRQRLVKDGRGSQLVPVFESPDEPVHNFCRFGIERLLNLEIPLGTYVRLDMTPMVVEQAPVTDGPPCAACDRTTAENTALRGLLADVTALRGQMDPR
jgi:hypothetical protein